MSTSKPLSLSPRKIFRYPDQSLAPFFPIHQFAKRTARNSMFPRSINLNRRFRACIVQKFRKLTNLLTPSVSPLKHFLLSHLAPSPKRGRFNDLAQSFQHFSSESEKRKKKKQQRRQKTAIFLASCENSDRRFRAYVVDISKEESKRRGPAFGRRDASVDASCSDEKNEKKRCKVA